MTAAAFNTLKTARDLKAAGLEVDQAEAIAVTMRDSVTEGVATRADVADVKANIFKAAIGIVVANAALTAGLLRASGGEANFALNRRNALPNDLSGKPSSTASAV